MQASATIYMSIAKGHSMGIYFPTGACVWHRPIAGLRGLCIVNLAAYLSLTIWFSSLSFTYMPGLSESGELRRQPTGADPTISSYMRPSLKLRLSVRLPNIACFCRSFSCVFTVRAMLMNIVSLSQYCT